MFSDAENYLKKYQDGINSSRVLHLSINNHNLEAGGYGVLEEDSFNHDGLVRASKGIDSEDLASGMSSIMESKESIAKMDKVDAVLDDNIPKSSSKRNYKIESMSMDSNAEKVREATVNAIPKSSSEGNDKIESVSTDLNAEKVREATVDANNPSNNEFFRSLLGKSKINKNINRRREFKKWVIKGIDKLVVDGSESAKNESILHVDSCFLSLNVIYDLSFSEACQYYFEKYSKKFKHSEDEWNNLVAAITSGGKSFGRSSKRKRNNLPGFQLYEHK